jgi:hypothetical protein
MRCQPMVSVEVRVVAGASAQVAPLVKAAGSIGGLIINGRLETAWERGKKGLLIRLRTTRDSRPKRTLP